MRIDNITTHDAEALSTLLGNRLVTTGETFAEFIWTDAKECLDELDRAIYAGHVSKIHRVRLAAFHFSQTSLVRRRIAAQDDDRARRDAAGDGYLAQGIEL